MQNTTRRTRGFTLIELMMTLAVFAILAAVAVPAFGTIGLATGAQTSRNILTTALSTARIFAITKTANVIVCPSDDQQYCGHTDQWQHGWLIFVDENRDGERDDGEEILSVSQALPPGIAILSSTGRTRVNYRPDGSATGSNATFTVCDRRGGENATSLVVNNAGRVRSGEPAKAAAATCMDALDPPQA